VNGRLGGVVPEGFRAASRLRLLRQDSEVGGQAARKDVRAIDMLIVLLNFAGPIMFFALLAIK
jgi:hypothetical protein